MLTEQKTWSGGTIDLALAGNDFKDGCIVTLMHKAVYPDGRMEGVWNRGAKFDVAGEYTVNLPPSVFAFELIPHPSGRHSDINVSVNGARVHYEYERAAASQPARADK